jgi:hypothetical protein
MSVSLQFQTPPAGRQTNGGTCKATRSGPAPPTPPNRVARGAAGPLAPPPAALRPPTRHHDLRPHTPTDSPTGLSLGLTCIQGRLGHWKCTWNRHHGLRVRETKRNATGAQIKAVGCAMKPKLLEFLSFLAKVWSSMDSARYDPRSNLHKHQPVRPAMSKFRERRGLLSGVAPGLWFPCLRRWGSGVTVSPNRLG